jgi:murein DD-endopeptidase MepM/ murein hydrolase activator NlpD
LVLKKLLWLSLIVALTLGGAAIPARAQESQPDLPIYVVQAGDTLWGIALRFGVDLNDLMRANNIADAGQIAEGAELVIPGLQGVRGRLETTEVPFGESLRSLTRRYQLGEDQLARLNHLTTRSEVFAGYILVVPQSEQSRAFGGRIGVAPGQTLLEAALLAGQNPWALAAANRLERRWQALPGEILRAAGAGAQASSDGPGALPGEIAGVAIDPLPLGQGRTTLIRVDGAPGLTLSGGLLGRTLHFFADSEGSYVAFQGVPALAEPGRYMLTISGTLPSGAPFSLSQAIPVVLINYPFDRPLTVDPKTVDPEVTGPEDRQWTGAAQAATPQRYWSGRFRLPSEKLPEAYCLDSGECWSSRFGNRRSYNGSPYRFFHTGLDIIGQPGDKIIAPAPGRVVFAGPLTVRGQATMIDHGWGIYTGYMHQSEILVQVGDIVEAGQVIGLVGRTGRVEGPHLHWEVWAGGVQVDPLEWLVRVFP